MIPVLRGAAPASLSGQEALHLPRLRALGRPPTGDDIVGYAVVAQDLWRRQHLKCCYCESRIQQRFHDVEHHRPKARADRQPGSALDHGYWWLAFDWENLLFACPGCNRRGKRDRFPLEIGSTPLLAEERPPGQERPLLLDPAGVENPVKHLVHRRRPLTPAGPHSWWVDPRDGSPLGSFTIDVCDLNREELRELRAKHVETVLDREATALHKALRTGDAGRIDDELDRAWTLFEPDQPYAALSYDYLCQTFPALDWPLPDEVGVGR